MVESLKGVTAATFFVDEPKNLGGNDKGANPLNTLLGGSF
jgi:hypothetical protein